MSWLSSCSDLPRPIVSVDSVTKAEYELRSFFEDENTNYDLRLRISEAILDSKPVTSILRSAQKRKRLFIYDREANVLRAYPAMPRPIHGTVTDLVSQFLMEAVRTNFITEDEQGCISSSTEGILLSRTQIHTSGKKHQGWIKYPEITILFRELDGRSLPRVVFEVGFNESYDDLQNDARQWLIRSRGLVRLVILVRIDEDVRQLQVYRNTSCFRSRVNDLVAKYGNDLGKIRAGIECEGSEDSDAEMYEDICSKIRATDWVGPITVSLEVWEMHNHIPTLREPPIAVFPAPASPQNPKINITDLIPTESRKRFKNIDNSRTAELDMGLFRQILASATKRLAHQRAITKIRPRPKEHNDPDYSPPSHPDSCSDCS